jgi:hypothetical protein
MKQVIIEQSEINNRNTQAKVRGLWRGGLATVAVAVLILYALALTGCSNAFSPQPNEAAAGYGRVTISVGGDALADPAAIADPAARTLYPAAGDFTGFAYTLSFNSDDPSYTGYTPADLSFVPGESASVDLPIAGNPWVITATAKTTSETPITVASGASGPITIVEAPAANAPVAITLAPYTDGENGIFAYDIDLTGITDVDNAYMQLYEYASDSKYGDEYDYDNKYYESDSLYDDETGNGVHITGAFDNVPPGYYFMRIRLERGDLGAGKSEIVHIYPGLTTSTPAYVFTEADLRPALMGTVTLSGNAETGQTLTADATGLEGSSDITYQWMRGILSGPGEPDNPFSIIEDAAGATYTLTVADLGMGIRVTVSRAGYDGGVTSNAIGPVELGEVITPTPTPAFVDGGDRFDKPTEDAITTATFTLSSATWSGATWKVYSAASGGDNWTQYIDISSSGTTLTMTAINDETEVWATTYWVSAQLAEHSESARAAAQVRNPTATPTVTADNQTVTKNTLAATSVRFDLEDYFSTYNEWRVYDSLAAVATHTVSAVVALDTTAFLTLQTQGGSPLTAKNYYVTEQREGRSESPPVMLTVQEAPATTAPAIPIATVAKTTLVQTPVSFTLSNPAVYTTNTLFAAYDAASDGLVVSGVTVTQNGATLSLTKSGGVAAGDYYITATNTYETVILNAESSPRVKLTVEEAPATETPTFDNPIVPKTTVTQNEVSFALNSSIESTYATVQVYADGTTPTVSATVQGEYASDGTGGWVYLKAIPEGNPVPAGTYWVTLTATDSNMNPIRTPSERVDLTVEEALSGTVAIIGYSAGGAPLIGQTLTADLSALVDPDNSGDKDPDDYFYQWYSDHTGNPISGATAQTYTLINADQGHTLLVRVSRNSSSVESAATAAVAKAITNGDGVGINGLVAPVISGTPVTSVTPAGSNYTAGISWQKQDPANPGTWSNNGATTFAAGSRYRATIRLTANEGYQLVNETTTPASPAYSAITPKVDGVTASEDWTISFQPGLEASGGLAGAGSNGPHSPGNYLEFWVTFPATPVPAGVSFSWNPLNHTVGVDTSALSVNPDDDTIHVARGTAGEGNHGTVAFSMAAPEGGSYTDLRWTLDGKDVDGPAGTGATYTFDAYFYEPGSTHYVGLKVLYNDDVDNPNYVWYGDSTNVVITVTE